MAPKDRAQVISIATEDLNRLERVLPELQDQYGPHWIESQRLDLIKALREQDDKALAETLGEIDTAKSELKQVLLLGQDAATAAKMNHTHPKYTGPASGRAQYWETVEEPAQYWESAQRLFRSPKLPLPQIRGANLDMIYCLIALLICVGISITAWQLNAATPNVIVPAFIASLIINYAFIGYHPDGMTNPLGAKMGLSTEKYEQASDTFAELTHHYCGLNKWIANIENLTPLPVMVKDFPDKLNSLETLGESERATALRNLARNALIDQIIDK